MDRLVRHFVEKTPIHLLDQHRQLMRRYGHSLCNGVLKSCLYSPSVIQTDALSHLDCMLSGSVAEGASLARVFSSDSELSNEMEIDVMIAIADWLTEEGFEYVDHNKAFAHIVVESEASTWVKSSFGEDSMRKLICNKEDQAYLSSQLTKIRFREMMTESPNIYNNIGFRQSVATKDCEAGSASITIQISDTVEEEQAESGEEPKPSRSQTSESATSTEASASAFGPEAESKLLKEIIPQCETFQIKMTEMLAHLQQIQNEFMEMRSADVPVSVYAQAPKALEWAVTCVEITDLVFDTNCSTVYRYFEEFMGWNPGIAAEEARDLMKGMLKTYIDQLTVSEKDVSSVSDAAAVCQLLSDIERTAIVPNRFLIGFREFARQQEMYLNVISYVDRNPQLSQIPQPLQQLSEKVKRISVDLVPCFKLTFWPSVAAEWTTRERVWPDQSVVDEIVGRGSHLIAKECCHDDIDWRLSFSVAEIELFSRWSSAQHFVYFIFKSLFYKFIKPLGADHAADGSSKKYLVSYMVKTVMLWTSESVEQSWWTENNFAECLTVLLLALQSAFECRRLDHYFVSSVNLFQGLPEVLATCVSDAIGSILADPALLIDQLEDHFEKTQLYFNALPAQMEIEKAFTSFQENIFSSLHAFPK